MLQRVLEILKVRWPEAAMLVGLFAGLSALMFQMKQDMLRPNSVPLPFWPSFILGVGFMTLIILLGMLFLGFLRSITIEPLSSRRPPELLQLGKPYFWKVFLFYILFELAGMLITMLFIAILHLLLYRQMPVDRIPDWILQFSQLASIAVLIKPLLLIPGIMLTQNSTLPEAFAQFRKVSILKMVPLIRGIWIGFAVLLMAFVLLHLAPLPENFFWIRYGMLSMVMGSVFLFFFITAMLQIREQLNPKQPEET